MFKVSILAAFALVNVSGLSQSALAQTQTIVGTASVIDGDTIEIHGKRIRLQGVDTPEEAKRCGKVNVHQRAANALADIIGRRTVTCVDTGQRNRQRIVASCSVSGRDLSEQLVSQGWARDWPQFSNGRYCDAERRARSNEQGLWGLSCPPDLWGNRSYKGCD